MSTRRLSRDEANALWHALGPRMRWFGRLCERMDMGIDPNDEIYKAAHDAYNAIHSLAIGSRYRSVGQGVGELPGISCV